MKLLKLGIMGFLMLIGFNANAVIINFDDIASSGAISGDRYLAEGVMMSSDAGLYAFTGGSYSNTPPVYIYGSSSGGSGADADVIFDFVAAADSASFYLADAETGTGSNWSAYAYYAGSLLSTIIGNTNDEVQVSFSGLGLIDRLVFSASSDFEGVDTLEFNVASVPEPATLLLMGAGLLGLGMVRKRKAA